MVPPGGMRARGSMLRGNANAAASYRGVRQENWHPRLGPWLSAPDKAIVGCSLRPNGFVEGSDVEPSLIFLFLRKLASRGIEQ
jgi:hypothetical protein